MLWAWGVVRVAAGRRAARRPQARGSAVVHSSRDDGQLRGSGSTAYREHAILTWDRVDPRSCAIASVKLEMWFNARSNNPTEQGRVIRTQRWKRKRRQELSSTTSSPPSIHARDALTKSTAPGCTHMAGRTHVCVIGLASGHSKVDVGASFELVRLASVEGLVLALVLGNLAGLHEVPLGQVEEFVADC